MPDPVTTPPNPAPNDDPANFPALFWRIWQSVWPPHAHLVWGAVCLVLTIAGFIGAWMGKPPPPLPPIPFDPKAGAMGWVEINEDERTEAMTALKKAQGLEPRFGAIAGALLEGDANDPVFFWEAERKVTGRLLGSWDQGNIGTCVANAWGRAVQDLLILQVAGGAAEKWPDREVAVEPIYGGSRVQIGGNRIRGDGSSGTWAAQWEVQYGNLFRQKYDSVDLSQYSVSLCRTWGTRGVPNTLIATCKEHPVKTAAMVSNSAEVWAAIGSGYPVPICSNVGFDGHPPPDGIMPPRGQWSHCMLTRGRFTDPQKGRCFVIQNSWGNYLSPVTITDAKRGQIALPEGCFAVTAASIDKIVRQQDSFAISGLVGFPQQKLDWITQRKASRLYDGRPLFALAP